MENIAAAESALEASFRRDVLDGLAQSRKTIPSRWLYDERGSILFEDITRLQEYYPTRVETDILTAHAGELAHFCGPGAVIVEYGAGSALKTEILLDALVAPRLYLGIDIAAAPIEQTAERLRRRYPEMPVAGVVADFTLPVDLPLDVPARNRVGFFPGSTIGNLTVPESETLLRAMRTQVGEGGGALIGIDLIKPLDVLLPAYDDREGVTAEFNRNLLTRINRELDGTFDPASFRHEARWNASDAAVEMHLVSRCEQRVAVGSRVFTFAAAETIHTESSRKYTVARFSDMARRSGWSVERIWSDIHDQYAIVGMRAE